MTKVKLKFQTVTDLDFSSFVDRVDKSVKSRVNPIYSRTVQDILSDYIDKGLFPDDNNLEYDDSDDPEPNNKDLAYISDNIDLINSLRDVENQSPNNINKNNINNKEEKNESDKDSSGGNNRIDIISEEASSN